MNPHFKIRQKPEQTLVSKQEYAQKQEPSALCKIFKQSRLQTDHTRRIQTEVSDSYKDSRPLKKTNLHPNKTLLQNKLIGNITSKNITCPSKPTRSQVSLKASSKIKSIPTNDNRKFKDKPHNLITEPSERFKCKIENRKVQLLFSNKNISTREKSLVTKEISGKEKYSFEEKVGSGTFGVVYKARNKNTLEVVAIKKVFQNKKYKNREGEILKLLDHINVIRMRDSFFTQENDGQYLNVVMDFFPDTVYSVIHKQNKHNPLSPILVKLYSYQILRSLLYLSKISICHRDIKPHNIIVDQQTNRLVMCDFGSAKRLVRGEANIAYICSRCYRAPELIFGATEYSTQIDMWSAGCVIAEMLVFQPLFMASNNIDQLVEIIKTLGTPTEDEVMEMNPEYDMTQFKFPQIPPRDWKKIFKNKPDPQLIDLLRGILKYSPNERLTPFKALCHPYFDELRSEKSFYRLKRELQIPELFNFTLDECTKAQKQLLQPIWARN